MDTPLGRTPFISAACASLSAGLGADSARLVALACSVEVGEPMLLAGAREVVEETYLDHNGTPPPDSHLHLSSLSPLIIMSTRALNRLSADFLTYIPPSE